jgi:hypothetical protein
VPQSGEVTSSGQPFKRKNSISATKKLNRAILQRVPCLTEVKIRRLLREHGDDSSY